METELWPNVIALAHDRGVPVFLVNARMSSAPASGYARIPSLTRPMMASLAGVAAQSDADAARLVALGAPPPAVTGNLKFDIDIADTAAVLGREFRLRFGEARPAWLAASTREGEEALILDAIERACVAAKDADRHRPSSPAAIRRDRGALARARHSVRARRSDNVAVPEDVDFLLGDSMGEMAGYCAAADVVFVGGSLLPLGGQNLDRADRDGTTDARRAAHVQFRRRDRQGARGRCCARGSRRRGVDCGSRTRSSAILRDATRCARPPLRSMPRIAAPRTACGAGSHRNSRRDARRRAGGARDQPRSCRLMSSTSWSDSVPTACFSRSTPIRYLK